MKLLRGIAEGDVERPKGPVAFILRDLKEHGAKLTEELVLEEAGEIPLAMLEEPEEQLT